MNKFMQYPLLGLLAGLLILLLAGCEASAPPEAVEAPVEEEVGEAVEAPAEAVEAAAEEVGEAVEAPAEAVEAAAEEASTMHEHEGLSIELESPGHWHFGHEKLLIFTVTDGNGEPVGGLSPTVVVKSAEGAIDQLADVLDNGDGTYAVEYTASNIGTGYAHAYGIGVIVEQDGTHYSNFWPVEVVRDGREDILPEVDGTQYAYQVRYGWSPGAPQPGDEVTIVFEPRRAVQTGADINTEQPWRNTFNHLPDLQDAHFLVQMPDGGTEEMPAEYAGLGIYRAVYTPEQVGEYTVSLMFTDPANGANIGQDDNAYTLTVAEAVAEVP